MTLFFLGHYIRTARPGGKQTRDTETLTLLAENERVQHTAKLERALQEDICFVIIGLSEDLLLVCPSYSVPLLGVAPLAVSVVAPNGA